MKHALALRLIVAAACLLGVVANLFASPVDSTKPKHPSTMNDTWFNNAEPEQHYIIDSTIFHLEEYNVVERNGREYENLGNTGSAAYPTVFDMDRSTGFKTGLNQFDLYRYTRDSAKYYQVIRPYAEFSMLIGLKKEQMYIGKFANQHKNMIYYGVEFTRINSPGAYTNQATLNNGFNLYGIFNSKNKHWNLQADLIFNWFKEQENGGVTDDPFNGTYFQKNLVPVATATGMNNYKQIDFYLKTSYSVGKKYYERKNDTLVEKTLLPVFKISYLFNVERNISKFSDLQPALDSSFYGSFYRPDSVVNNINYLKFGNSLMLEYRPRKLTSDSTYEEKDFIAYAEAGFEYFMLTQNRYGNNFGDLYVGGTFRNNYASKPKIIYRASTRYYLYGYNQNDFIADALAGYDFGKFGTITGNFTYQLKEAPYIYEQFRYDSALSWHYKLPKTKTFGVGGKYQIPKIGITADVNYYVADHLPVYPGYANPYVTNGEENVIVAHFGNRNSVVGLHFDNDVWYSAIANAGYIKSTYPTLFLKSSVYYENRIFKKVLWFAIGVDVRYRYTNNAPYYDPFLGSFYPTYVNLTSYPTLDFFLNFKIKTVRIFLKVDNLTSAGGRGYYPMYAYPAADLSFKAGIKWRFFE